MEHIMPSAFNSPQRSTNLQGNGPVVIKEAVDLNKILHQALKATQPPIETLQIIIRCDELPVAEGYRPDFEGVFFRIMQLVLSQKPVGSKQFLYVKCEEEELPKDGVNLSNHGKTYMIQFHTNIVLDAYWEAAYRPVITECEQIAKIYSGSFAYTRVHSGSLFTLRIPGKPL